MVGIVGVYHGGYSRCTMVGIPRVEERSTMVGIPRVSSGCIIASQGGYNEGYEPPRVGITRVMNLPGCERCIIASQCVKRCIIASLVGICRV